MTHPAAQLQLIINDFISNKKAFAVKGKGFKYYFGYGLMNTPSRQVSFCI
jgi:hypothetical protein